jgi:thiol-disulfide isomerase/thioredoxin
MSRARPGRRFRIGAALVVAVLASSCADPARRPARDRPERAAAPSTARTGTSTPPIDPQRLHAVVLNGGGDRAGNYFSHSVHVRSILAVLEAAQVPQENVTIFASDGEDPTPDLAVRELRPDGDTWILDGTGLDATVGEPIEYVDTDLQGRRARPATRAELERWFAEEARALRSGDTLLFYVTDHGTRGEKGPRDNRISLWGRGESLSVDELKPLLDGLDPGVRVVALMSQCFSGGFGLLAADPSGVLPTGNYCGFYSSTPDRPAYGCYAENRGADDVGHSVRFIESLVADGGFPESHRHTLASDHTPDVPLRTTDLFLRDRLARAAAAKGVEPAVFTDSMLAEAWRDKARFESDIRLLDRLGQIYGFASPRSLEEVDARLAQLPEVGDAIDEHAEAWTQARNDLARANLKRFFAAEPEWRDRVTADETRKLTPTAARVVGTELLGSLGPFTREDSGTERRLRSLRDRAGVADEVSYRMAVREAVLLRMETLLNRIAGQAYLQGPASAEERQAYARLESCEALTLPTAGTSPEVAPAPFPTYAEDVQLAETVLPGWMGIQFRQASADVRTKNGLAEGAVRVQRVYPDSPAERAGIGVGDVVIGPPGEPFAEPHQIREWTMLSSIGEPRPLEVLHDGDRVLRKLVPGPHPGRFPALPAPPRVGSVAPELHLDRYRGQVPTTLADGRPHLLFFWATWCAPCKASLGELLAFAKEKGVDVVAVTDEETPQLDGFFASFREPFPVNVAVDPDRDAFLGYGVSGTPTFVLVDGSGRITHYNTGYNQARGLDLPGWKRSAG